MAINVSMVSSRFLKPWKSATADFSNDFLYQQVRPDFISLEMKTTLLSYREHNHATFSCLDKIHENSISDHDSAKKPILI
jgi:hypothetical protein